MIRLHQVTRHLPSGARTLSVLDGIELTVPAGQFACIVGPSGSGKSTLLGLVAGIDRPSSGQIVVAGQDYERLSEDELAEFRGRNIGIVFQSFHLIPTLTALENVLIPMELLGQSSLRDAAREGAPREERNQGHAAARKRAAALLARVGLADRATHYPVQLSGGEQQRVALARAFANAPALLLADEPTGNLDSRNGEQVLGLLEELHRDAGTTLLVVTHETNLARRADRVIRLADGRVVEDGRAAS
ncbi:MAG: ABC transporter ATP-binding protein [Candidatus Riflebacteria bacterium]|nr:ABC transporter ATP-binding protein [Candidatus Riflebacteria bacterium]